MLFYVGFGVILAICGYFDHKKSKIPDVVTALAWVYFSFLGTVLLREVAFYLFSLIFLANTYKQVIGWADILLIPLWLSALILGFNIIGIVGVLLFCLSLSRVKANAPLINRMAFIYWVILVIYNVLQIVP